MRLEYDLNEPEDTMLHCGVVITQFGGEATVLPVDMAVYGCARYLVREARGDPFREWDSSGLQTRHHRLLIEILRPPDSPLFRHRVYA